MSPIISQALAAIEKKPDALLSVVGPTASGKTSLAIALAEHFDGEVVSADSVQLYREFDIGSGKPTAGEQSRARHHLVDVIGPLDAIDAARFGDMADAAIADIRARGKRPIVCGGTFLWVKALVHGLAEAPRGNEEIRARHRAIAEAEGRAALHTMLRAVDPESATRLHENDLIRVSRALEVFELSGTKLSAWHAAHGFRAKKHDTLFLGLGFTADALTERITARVHAWLARGWIDEVRALRAKGYDGARAMGSVGYREVRAHLDGEIPANELAETIVRATRVFARRQRTWLKSEDVTWLGEGA